MLSSQSASNPKILLFLSFASSAEIVFVSDALLLLLSDIHAGDYSFMVALPHQTNGFCARAPRISIAPHQLVRRREKFLRSEFNFLKLSLGDLLLTPPSIPTFLFLSRTLIEVERQQKSEKERRPSSSEREAEATEAFFLLFPPPPCCFSGDWLSLLGRGRRGKGGGVIKRRKR